MKYFLITYRFTEESEENWHQEIARFVTALESDTELKDKITYHCLKSTKGPEYYHLATTLDEDTATLLSERDFFKHYIAQNKIIASGSVEVTPLELVAATTKIA